MKKSNGVYYFPFALAGFSTRAVGSVKHGNKFDRRFIEQLSNVIGSSKQITYMVQKHTTNIEIVKKDSASEIFNTDGLITQEKNKVLLAVTADCVPIVMYDSVKKIIGVVHAGYKGILLGIVENMIKKFIKLGSELSNIKIGIGPSIGVCCYDVSKDRIEQFKQRYPGFKNFFQKKHALYFLDLQSIVLQILKQFKVQNKNIERVNLCTSCNNEQFFSYRKDSNKTFGEFATFIGMI